MSNVSVVVTNYNHTHFLSVALDSLRNQTRSPYEVIIVDDGSVTPVDGVDGSLPNLTVLRTPHRGVGAALNAAVALMRGDVLCWLPADDWWEREKLEKQQAFSASNPGCVLHSFCKVHIAGDSCVVGRPPRLTDEEFAKAIRTSSPYYATTFWIPKPVLDVVGPFREDVPASEDYQWVLRSVVRHGVKYRLQDEVLAVKRKHPNTLTVTHQQEIPELVARFNREVNEDCSD